MGNGSTTEFNFNFPYFENSNIIVTVNNQTASAYNIIGTSGGEDADFPYTGGKVVFETAPTSFDNITIARNLPLTRVVDYQPTAKIDPTTLNQDLNYLMEVLKDFDDGLYSLYAQYSDIANKDSTTTLLARIAAFNALISDGVIMKTSKFYSHTANCITEIPQYITLKLSSGTLTLKAGSKCYLKTDTTTPSVSVTSDLTTTQTTDGTYFAIYDGSALTTVLTNAYDYSTLPNTYSLPLAIVTVSGGAIKSIDQVFNGFGYIGSTVFVLPGVKGLIPNGRNADGTLNNTGVTVQSVLTKTIPSNTGWHYISINGTGTNLDFATNFYSGASLPSGATNLSRFYNTDENKIYTVVSGALTGAAILVPSCRIEHSTSSPYAITSMGHATAFHTADYNDKEYIANCAMPSNKYIDLTLGASGTTYTAPADGYFTITKTASAADEYIYIQNTSNGMNTGVMATSASNCCVYLPVSKGQSVTVNYTTGGTTETFRFIYVNGAK